jgi:hypothetical protein
MGEKSDPKKTSGASKPDRDARLKAALKSNMAKRKAQARQRSAAAGGGGSGDKT